MHEEKDEFLEAIDEGRAGKNKGVPGGLPTFDRRTFNTQHGKIYTIAGQSKSGKTYLLLYRYIIIPFLSNADVDWVFYSLEMDKIQIKARLTSYFAWYHNKFILKNPVSARFSVNKILGYGADNPSDVLTQEEYEFILEINRLYINPLFGYHDGEKYVKGRIEFIEDVNDSNPTAIYKYLLTRAKENGEFLKSTYHIKKDDGTLVEKERIHSYVSNTERKTWVIIDHMLLMKKENKNDSKRNIDLFVNEQAKTLRNICKYTFVFISQVNRSVKSTDRQKLSGELLQTNVEDIKETGSMEETSDMIITIFNPSAFPHLTTHMGYKLSEFYGYYRSLHVVASRISDSPINKSVLFDPEICNFTELPDPDDPTIENFKAAAKKLYEQKKRK